MRAALSDPERRHALLDGEVCAVLDDRPEPPARAGHQREQASFAEEHLHAGGARLGQISTLELGSSLDPRNEDRRIGSGAMVARDRCDSSGPPRHTRPRMRPAAPSDGGRVVARGQRRGGREPWRAHGAAPRWCRASRRRGPGLSATTSAAASSGSSASRPPCGPPGSFRISRAQRSAPRRSPR